MKTLLKYDFIFLKRTSKFIVFPAIAIFFAISSPLLAKYMPEILKLLLGSDGLSVQIPEVSVLDSYIQYVGNLFELYLIVSIFVGVSIFMREKNKGELPLLLSKPVNRTKYIISKYISFSILILLSLAIGGLIFSYYTYYLFDTVNILIVVYMTLLFFIYSCFILSISLLTAMYFNSYAGASIITFVAFLVLSIIGGFSKGLIEYLPGRVTQRISEVILEISEVNTMLPTIIIMIGLTGLFSFLGILKFRKYDI